MRTIDKEYVLKMKNSAGKPSYYKYCTVPAGSSDIASLLYRTGYQQSAPWNREMGEIPFGEDGSYQAHLIAGDTEVPDHYRENKILDTEGPWLWIYDDDGKSLDLSNDAGFEVYIAGRMGLLIKFK